MMEKNLEREREKFKKAKQQWLSTNATNKDTNTTIEKYKKENERLKKQLQQKASDIKKLANKGGEDGYKKLFDDANKTIRTLQNTQTEQNKKINKQRTEIQQLKAQQNRNRSDNQSDNKQIFKLKKEKQKADRTISDLRQQLSDMEKKLSAMAYKSDRNSRSDRVQTELNLEQINVQQRRLERKLKQIKEKELEMQESERRQNAAKKDMRTKQNKLTLQQQQEMDAQEKRFNRKKKQEMADIAKQRQDLERQQKLLESQQRNRKRKSGKGEDKEAKHKRHERKRTERTKIIIHKKYLCKDYMQTCTKWRKRRDGISASQTKLKELLSKIEGKMKRLKELEKRIKKGQNNKNEKPNKADMKEYLDAVIPLEDYENELGDMLLEMHPEYKELKAMPGELLQKQEEIDELRDEVERLEHQLEKLKIERRLSSSQPNLKNALIMGAIDEIDREFDDSEDEEELKEDDDNLPNPYKLEFDGIYRKVVKNLEDEKGEILGQLKDLINKIGDDLRDESSQIHQDRAKSKRHRKGENDRPPFITELSSDYRENGLLDFKPKTEGLSNEYRTIEQKLEEDDDEYDADFDGKGRLYMQNKDKRNNRDNDDPFSNVRSGRSKSDKRFRKRKRTRSSM